MAHPTYWARVLAAAGMVLAAALAEGCSHGGGGGTTLSTSAAKVRHVFVIVLENKDYADTFGTSKQDPYLQKTLVPMGALLTQYYGTGHVSLDNYLSMISGQAPTPDTDNDCITSFSTSAGRYIDVVQTGTAADGQVIASGGCVYAAGVKTLADQLSEARLTWKGYMGDMGNDPSRESATCGHPVLGGPDNTNKAEAPSAAVPAGDAYATRHDPFMYFHSIIDTPSCATNVVNLQRLPVDLASIPSTPNFAFITPNLCDDAHDGDGTGTKGKTCANGQPGGLTSADAFLRTWVPKILASPAYQQDGLLIITFDEGNFTQSASTSGGVKAVTLTATGASCCDQKPGPNLAGVRPTTITLATTPTVVKLVIQGYGGDRVGALLLSPFVKAGTTSATPYNHYALLRSLEDIYGLPSHLGYAAQAGLQTLGNDPAVFN